MTDLLAIVATLGARLDDLEADVRGGLELLKNGEQARNAAARVAGSNDGGETVRGIRFAKVSSRHGSDRLALIRSRTICTTQDAPPPVNDAGGTGEVHPHKPDPTEPTPFHVPA